MEQPFNILAIDTASLAGSVALWQDNQLLAESLLNVRSTHSERLLGQIDHLLVSTGLNVGDLHLIAVVHGPGSFTGLRVGLATAKGLATGAGLPTVGLSTLEVLAMNLPFCPYPVCAFLDARKKEVYSCLYETDSGYPEPLDKEKVLSPEKTLADLNGEVALVGSGVGLYRELIDTTLGERAKLPPEMVHQPRAAAAAVLARRKFAAGQAIPPARLAPCYIRPSDADLPKTKGG